MRTSWAVQTDQGGRPPGNDSGPAFTQRRWVYEVGYATLVAGTAALVLSPVLRRSGWPLNQATTAPLLLVQIYAAHFRHLDFLPVWSSTDGYGMGSPVLLYYHRTFFYIAGFIYALLGGGLKPSVVATIAIFLAVGAYGMRQALGIVTNSGMLRTVGSLGFLLANYVFTDWLDPRGDLAEFSALMIVPWLLYWCLNLVKHRRVSFLLIPIMVLLVNAHSAIALTSLFTLVIALVTFVTVAGFRGLRAMALRLIVSVTGATLFLAPTLLAELRFSQFYDPQTKNTIAGWAVSQQFVRFGSYFYDRMHRWFSPDQLPPRLNFVQIDFAIWVPIAATMAAIGGYWILRVWRRNRWRPLGRLHLPVVVFLVVSLAVYLFLQLRISYDVYRLLTPLQIINFPWRMLAFITPIGVILVMVIADDLMRRYPIRVFWGALMGGWFASLVVLSPITSSLVIENGFYAAPGQFPTMGLFTAPRDVDYQTFNGFFLGGGLGPLYNVFLPKVFAANGREVGYVLPLYARLHQQQAGAQSLSQVPCTVVGPPHAPFETLQLTFSVTCDSATRLALPVSYSAYSKVSLERAGGKLRQIPYFHVRTDPRIVINLASSQHETVVVQLPTLWGILS